MSKPSTFAYNECIIGNLMIINKLSAVGGVNYAINFYKKKK